MVEYVKNLKIDDTIDATGATKINIGGGVTGQDYQDLADGKLLAVGDGLRTTIDPGTTTTPIQDAVDAITGLSRAKGVIYLPPTEVSYSGGVTWANNISMIGAGEPTARFPDAPSIIKRSDDDNGPAIDLNGAEAVRLDGFAIHGTGDTGTATAALSDTGGAFNIRIGSLAVNSWRGKAIDIDPFQLQADKIHIDRVDAGDQAALIDLDLGPDCTIHEIIAYPTDSDTAQNSTIVQAEGGHLEIGSMNLGKASGQILEIPFTTTSFELGAVNYEPTSVNSTVTYLITAKGTKKQIVRGPLVLNDFGGVLDVTNIYNADQDTDMFLASPSYKNGATINGNVVRIFGDVTGDNRIIYEGTVDEVDNGSGSLLTNPIVCLGDVTKKKSTGAGYDGGTDDSQL